MIEDVILHHSIVVQLRSMVLRRRNVGTGKSVSHVAEFFFLLLLFWELSKWSIMYVTLITVRIKALYTSLQLFCFNVCRLDYEP